MKTILFVDHTPFAGGAQLVLAEHIAQLDKTEFTIHVACTDTVPLLVERYQRAGATVHCMDFSKLKRLHPRIVMDYWQSVRQLRQLMRNIGADLVVSNTSRTAYVASLSVLGTSIPLIWWVRDFLYSRWLFATLGRISRRIICVSKAIKMAYMPADDPRGVIVYVASNLYQKLADVSPKQIKQERERWGVKESDIVIGFMGRLVAEKGPEDVVAALNEIDLPHVKAMLVGTGGGQEHDVEEKLHHLAHSLGLDDKIIFTGYQSDEALYYSLFDIFVLATRDREPFATTVVQAMMAGKPVVATDNGGTPELVFHNETGLLIPAHNAHAMAEAFRRLLSRDFAGQIAAAGKARVLQYHREEVTTNQLKTIYMDVLAKG